MDLVRCWRAQASRGGPPLGYLQHAERLPTSKRAEKTPDVTARTYHGQTDGFVATEAGGGRGHIRRHRNQIVDRSWRVRASELAPLRFATIFLPGFSDYEQFR